MDRAQQFREAAATANNHPLKSRWRYSEQLRRLALEHYRERRREGRPLLQITEELGVSAHTLSRWRKRAEKSTAQFQPVRVTESRPTPASLLRVTTPGGLRIEGLSFQQVVELVRMGT